mmetsp:Transcript_14805/g.46543  ORF Transcript_14805/g.46543 Transcript_14805/m.46543 type:complete len:200 (-) Transcript_14805:455-1054(-)
MVSISRRGFLRRSQSTASASSKRLSGVCCGSRTTRSGGGGSSASGTTLRGRPRFLAGCCGSGLSGGGGGGGGLSAGAEETMTSWRRFAGCGTEAMRCRRLELCSTTLAARSTRPASYSAAAARTSCSSSSMTSSTFSSEARHSGALRPCSSRKVESFAEHQATIFPRALTRFVPRSSQTTRSTSTPRYLEPSSRHRSFW